MEITVRFDNELIRASQDVEPRCIFYQFTQRWAKKFAPPGVTLRPGDIAYVVCTSEPLVKWSLWDCSRTTTFPDGTVERREWQQSGMPNHGIRRIQLSQIHFIEDE